MLNRKSLIVILPILLVAIVALGAVATGWINVPTSLIGVQITPTPPAEWNIHAKSTFQIALPNSWQEIPLDDATLKSKIDAASNDNPHLADTLRAILTTGQNKNLLFYAVDKNGTNIIDNVSIARTTISDTVTIEQATHDYANALPLALKGTKLIAFDAPLEINGQKAGEVNYELPLVNSAGQIVTLSGVQYLFLANAGNMYGVTVTGNATDADRFVPLARQIARSFVQLEH